MTTALDIINQAAKKSGVLGVGQTLLAEDVNDAYQDLQDLLAQWQRKRWLITHLVEYSVTSSGAQSYSVGPGGDFNISPRPDRIESAFFRQIITSNPNFVDYPLSCIQAREDYNLIALKQLTSFPQYYFYDSAFPTAALYPWPIVQASIYQIHITVKETLSQFTSLAEDVNLPLEYIPAMKFNLAIRLRQAYRLPPDPTLIGLAKDSLAVLRNANTQIPRLQIEKDLIRPGGIYNYYSDTFY